MNVYWWPYLHDEYFYSIEFIAVAASKEDAIDIVLKKIDDIKEKSPCLNKEFLEIDTNSWKRSIKTDEPEVLRTDIPNCDYAETNR